MRVCALVSSADAGEARLSRSGSSTKRRYPAAPALTDEPDPLAVQERLADVIRNALPHWETLTLFRDYGSIELYNNTVERSSARRLSRLAKGRGVTPSVNSCPGALG